MENFLCNVIICTMILLRISLVQQLQKQLKESRKNNEHSEDI